MQHAVETIGQIGASRHLVRNPGFSDFGLGPHNSLRERRRRCEKGVRDFFRRQPADLTQRQCDTRIGAQCGVAAGEDESEAIVLELVIVSRRIGARFNSVDHCAVDIGESSVPAQPVDGLEATGRHQPGTRVRGDSIRVPLLDCRGEGVVQRFFGEVEIIEQADERCEHTARFGAIQRIDLVAHVCHAVVPHSGRAACQRFSGLWVRGITLDDRPHLDRAKPH